jgi:hypothetical protein
MTISRLAILMDIAFQSGTVRLWDGAGPKKFDGDVWFGAGLFNGIDEIEAALNGEATRLDVMFPMQSSVADKLYQAYVDNNVTGTRVRTMLQPLDEFGVATGSKRTITRFIDDVDFADGVQLADANGDPVILSTVTAHLVNRMDLRNLSSGAVLSDADQQLRSPGDRIAEFVPGLIDISLDWPDWS